MPTRVQWEELCHNTTNVWTTRNGVNGRLFTATNGNSLFLPAAGYRWGGELYNAGYIGDYWSSSLYAGNPDSAWNFGFVSGYYGMGGHNRGGGRSVRAVRPASQN